MRGLLFRDRLKNMKIVRFKPVQLVIITILKWQQDGCLDMGSALAYYALFSLFPFFLVILSIIGFLLGPNTNIHNQLLSLAESSLPPSTFDFFISTLFHLNQSSIGAGLTGFCLLLFTASNVFFALARFANKIWQVKRVEAVNNNLMTNGLNFLKGRILALALVLGTSMLMLFSLLYDITTTVIVKVVHEFNQSIDFVQIDSFWLLNRLEKGTIFLLLSFAIMVLFKILPSTMIAWGDVWLGALMTVTLFVLFQNLATSSIFELGNHFISYGVFGSVMVLLLWIYISCQIFFLGCEFTYVYAHLFGSHRKRKIDSI